MAWVNLRPGKVVVSQQRDFRAMVTPSTSPNSFLGSLLSAFHGRTKVGSVCRIMLENRVLCFQASPVKQGYYAQNYVRLEVKCWNYAGLNNDNDNDNDKILTLHHHRDSLQTPASWWKWPAPQRTKGLSKRELWLQRPAVNKQGHHWGRKKEKEKPVNSLDRLQKGIWFCSPWLDIKMPWNVQIVTNHCPVPSS